MRSFRLLVLVFLFLAAKLVQAQDDPNFEIGLKPYGSYHMGKIDNINLMNGSLGVDIPLISYPQRGGKLTLDFALHYFNGSSDETTECFSSEWGTICTPIPNGSYAGFQIIDKQAFTYGAALNFDGEYQPCSSINDYTVCNLAVSDTDGASHLYAPMNQAGTAFRSIDATGIFASSTAWTDSLGIVHTNVVYGGTVLSDSREDANGNEITYASSTGWTDTLGRTIPAVPAPSSSGVSACPQPPTVPLSPATVSVWSPPGLNGGTYTIEFCYATFTFVYGGNNYNTSILQSVVLPNGTAWNFSYAQATQAVIPIANLTQIAFPTGGTLSYTWTGTYGCTIAEGSGANQAVLTRTMNDGISPAAEWSYSYASSGTTITDPVGNASVHTFGFGNPGTQNTCQPYENQAKYYQGSATNGTLLKTTNTYYQYSALPWQGYLSYPEYANVVPLTQDAIWANNQESQVTHQYDTGFTVCAPVDTADCASNLELTAIYGKELTKNEYDYGTNGPGSLLRTTTYSWLALNNSNYLTYNLMNLPASVQVTGSGPGSYTTYSYDQYALASSGITTQHVTPPNGTYRGNPTSVSYWLSGSTTATTNCNISISNGYLTSYKTYNDTGTVATSVDSCGMSYTDPNHTTTYAYSSSYVGALPTTITNPLSQSTTNTYDFNTGLLLTTQDPNLLTTTYTYDSMLRTLQIAKPDGGQTFFCYTDTGTESGGGTCSQSGPPYDVVVTETINSSTSRNSFLQIDGVGREIRQAVQNGENGYDEVDTCYDGDGRVSFESYPYQTASISGTRCSNSSTPGDSTVYDGLSRLTSVTHADNSVISTSYTGSATTVTDEQGKTSESFTDGLGRLEEVIENPSGLNYTTTYTYDALNNLTEVSQSSSRQRTFVYDSLAHLTSSTNPESNWSPSNLSYVATTYSYDADGNLINKTEPAQNQQGTSTVTLTYCYDVLNRMISKAYTLQACTGTHGMSTSPLVSYYYDGAHQLPGFCRFPLIRGYDIGHRNAMCDAAGWESWGYNIVSGSGWQITDERQTNSITTTAVYQDNFLGLPTSIQYPSARTINYNYNVAGRPTYALDATTSVYYANTIHYAANGSRCWSVYGGAITGATTFNARLQPLEMQGTGSVVTYPGSCSGLGQTGNLFDLTYNFNYGTGDNGNVVGITNNIDGTRSQGFTYDALNRISSAYTASTYSTSPAHCWGENYQFDNQASGGAWGNLTAITAMTGNYSGCTQESGLSVTATAQNQISNGSTYGYDTAGNMTTNGSNTYTYDAENHLTSTAGVTYTYDGDGKRVMKSSGPIYWYGLNGEVLDETDLTGSTTDSSFYEYVFLGGDRIARHDSSNNVYYYTSDHLGTSRVIAEVPSGGSSATLCYDADFYPFGGERAYTNTCSQNYKFTGKERDTESCAAGTCLDNFGARYDASSTGRFMSPDPLIVANEKIGDPQQWNAYTYTRNNPSRFTDPTGMYTCVDDNNQCNTANDRAFINALLQVRLSGIEGAAAAAAYGGKGEDNGVSVNFSATMANSDEGAKVEPSIKADAKGNISPDIKVTFLSGASGIDPEFISTVAHEGDHVRDDMNFLKSFNPKTGFFDASKNFTHLQTEFTAYQLKISILLGRLGGGHDYMVLGQIFSPKQLYTQSQIDGKIMDGLKDPANHYSKILGNLQFPPTDFPQQ